MCRNSVLIESRGFFKSISYRERIMRARLFVVTGLVGVFTTVAEDGAAAGQTIASMLALRLKVQNRQISEVEALFVRPAANAGGGGRGVVPAPAANAAGGARGAVAGGAAPAAAGA